MSDDFSDIMLGDRFICRNGDIVEVVAIDTDDDFYPIRAVDISNGGANYFTSAGSFYARPGPSQFDFVEKATPNKQLTQGAKNMDKEEYFDFVDNLFKEMQDLMRAKNNDYTADAGPFSNFENTEDFGVDRLTGLMIRMSDKFQRLKAYSKTGKLLVKDEGVEDAFKDMIGYSCLALGMLKEDNK